MQDRHLCLYATFSMTPQCPPHFVISGIATAQKSEWNKTAGHLKKDLFQ